MDPLTIAGILSGSGTVMNAGTGLLSFFQQRKVDKQNYEMALKNYESQQGLIDWNKAVQEQNWIREDTAVQRRVADMKAAGLNPILAAGQGAPSTFHPVANHPAPPRLEHNSPQYMAMMGDALGKFAQLAQTREQTRLLRKQADRVDAETANIERETRFFDTREAQIIHDMAVNVATHRLNVRRHELDRERFKFEESYKGKQLQLELDKFNFDKTVKEFYKGLGFLDYLLRERGVEVEEREIALEEMIRGFEMEIKERDIDIESVLGLRHKEQFGPFLREIMQLMQYVFMGESGVNYNRIRNFWRRQR